MTLNLRANLPVDDNDSHFAYSAGDWSTLAGSTRQFEGSVHVTNNVGATVAFAYQGVSLTNMFFLARGPRRLRSRKFIPPAYV